jgi:hypothetical protein
MTTNPMTTKTNDRMLTTPQEWEFTRIGLAQLLLDSPAINTGTWQSIDVSMSPAHVTHEIMNVHLDFAVPITRWNWQEITKPNMPWAENHFNERVAGAPTNPGDTYKDWPWYAGGVEDHKATGVFSHTYQERYWPQYAGEAGENIHTPNHGIRYPYGDLRDVVNLLVDNRHTRQAYLPVWFPEDTGGGKRVPCSLGYHFMIRDNLLHCWYAMRSCDFIRYLSDDVYLTGRLMQWVANQINKQTDDDPTIPEVTPGVLSMTISSLHCFVGDEYRLGEIVGTE